jgi:tetraacyldisaccharide 4'-kinase
VCGIARPQRFRRSLEAEGAVVAGFSTYRDHHRFTAAELRGEMAAARAEGSVPVTTAKDAVRFPHEVDREPWRVLEIVLEVDGGWDRLVAGADAP